MPENLSESESSQNLSESESSRVINPSKLGSSFPQVALQRMLHMTTEPCPTRRLVAVASLSGRPPGIPHMDFRFRRSVPSSAALLCQESVGCTAQSGLYRTVSFFHTSGAGSWCKAEALQAMYHPRHKNEILRLMRSLPSFPGSLGVPCPFRECWPADRRANLFS